MVEDIGGFGDAERLAHLGEHVGLRFAVLWGGFGVSFFFGGRGRERGGERERYLVRRVYVWVQRETEGDDFVRGGEKNDAPVKSQAVSGVCT